MILDIEQIPFGNGIQLKISYFDKDGKVDYLYKDIDEPWKWEICSSIDSNKDKNFQNWNKKSVKKVKASFLSKFEIYEFIQCLSDKDKEILSEFNFPRLCSIDIETEIAKEFPNPEIAEQMINAISICWKFEQIGEKTSLNIISMGVKHLTDLQKQQNLSFIKDYLSKSKISKDFEINWKYFQFDDEIKMLKAFIEKILPSCPVITGWNFIDFDWTYIKNRISRLNAYGKVIGEFYNLDLAKASSSKKVSKSKEGFPLHIYGFDYLDFYKKYDRIVKIKESNKLDYVAEQATGLKKLKYNGGLQELYENDFPTFINYNAIDSALVILIHERLRTIDPIFMLANQNMLTINKCTSPVALTENMLFSEYFKNGYLVADKFEELQTDMSYVGAYVMDPKPGLYKDVACYDFASLYPSIMRQYNMSPESFVEKVDLTSESSFMKEKIQKYRNDEKLTVSPSGAVFKIDKPSILKTILDKLYTQRKVYKKRMFEIEKHLDKFGVH